MPGNKLCFGAQVALLGPLWGVCWWDADFHVFVYVIVCAAIYTVMCYNVLCDKYATRQLYGYCPSWALNWEYRKKIILDEIRQYSADIISLQVGRPRLALVHMLAASAVCEIKDMKASWGHVKKFIGQINTCKLC